MAIATLRLRKRLADGGFERRLRVRSLLARGTVRPDPLRIGLEVTPDCMVIGVNGRPTPGLYACGPLTRGTFFEIDAVAEIRHQCARIAAALN